MRICPNCDKMCRLTTDRCWNCGSLLPLLPITPAQCDGERPKLSIEQAMKCPNCNRDNEPHRSVCYHCREDIVCAPKTATPPTEPEGTREEIDSRWLERSKRRVDEATAVWVQAWHEAADAEEHEAKTRQVLQAARRRYESAMRSSACVSDAERKDSDLLCDGELRADRDLEKKLRKDAEHAVCDAAELLEEIMRGKVNPEDDAEKWLRTYDPIRLNRRTETPNAPLTNRDGVRPDAD